MIEFNFIFGLAVYCLIWFITLFIILPFGTSTKKEDEDSYVSIDVDNPPHILRKLVINSLLSGGIYMIVYGLFTSDIFVN